MNRNSIKLHSHRNILFFILENEGVEINYTSFVILVLGLNGITSPALALTIYPYIHLLLYGRMALFVFISNKIYISIRTLK